MNSPDPATTPAPQKITPDCRFVFPCWAYHVPSVRWIRLKAHFDIGLGTARQLLGFGYSHYAPDSETAPTCTPSEGEYVPTDDERETAATVVREEMAKRSLQPTHSAQEGAERAASEIADQYFHNTALEKRAIFSAIILRHLRRTPTQSQQPPLEHPDTITLRAWQEAFGTNQLSHALARLEKAERPFSPGSGEAMREALNLAMSLAFAGMNGLSDAEIERWANDSSLARDMRQDAIDCLKCRKALAQPATPPLTSGEYSLEDVLTLLRGSICYSTGAHAYIWSIQAENLQEGVESAIARLLKKNAPPLTSIGDGKDGERDRAALQDALLSFRLIESYCQSAKWHLIATEAHKGRERIDQLPILKQRDAAMSAQSPQAGREEK